MNKLFIYVSLMSFSIFFYSCSSTGRASRALASDEVSLLTDEERISRLELILKQPSNRELPLAERLSLLENIIGLNTVDVSSFEAFKSYVLKDTMKRNLALFSNFKADSTMSSEFFKNAIVYLENCLMSAKILSREKSIPTYDEIGFRFNKDYKQSKVWTFMPTSNRNALFFEIALDEKLPSVAACAQEVLLYLK